MFKGPIYSSGWVGGLTFEGRMSAMMTLPFPIAHAR